MSNNYKGLIVANPKLNWRNYGGYWLNDWVNYQGLFGRARPQYPQVNFMEIFAQKKANILCQEVSVDSDDPKIEAFLKRTDWTNLVRDCIQQASINGYAVVDIERVPNRDKMVETFVYCNPFPSPYDQWDYINFETRADAVTFQTCFSTQKFQTPFIAIMAKTNTYFILEDIGGIKDTQFLEGVMPLFIPDSPMINFFSNTALRGYKIRYSQLVVKETNERVWPHLDANHMPFYVWRNRDFTLGYKDLIQESDMWFLGNFGHLISSYFERLYQEQEMNITRVFGNFDPQIQNSLEDSWEENGNVPFVSENERLLRQTNNAFSYKRAFSFTTLDASKVAVEPSTYQGSQEVQGFKDLLDLCFKWCIGFELFGESATRESTATENLQRAISEREVILTYTNFLRKQVRDIVRNVLYYQFGETVNDEMWDVTIHNQRGETASAEQQAILAIYQAGLCTLETSLRMLHPNWTDRQIKKEQETLEIQQQQQMAQQQLASQNQAPAGNPTSAQQPDQNSGAEQTTNQIDDE